MCVCVCVCVCERDAMCDRNDLAIEQEMNNKGRADINITESMEYVSVHNIIPCIININV